MRKILTMVTASALLLAAGSVWAYPHHRSHKQHTLKVYHNPHRTGPASNAKPGDHPHHRKA